MKKKALPKARKGGAEAIAEPKKRRGPTFPISRQEVIKRCRERGHDMLCAGEVLALMDLMEIEQWSMLELHERSHVARSMIHDLLTMDAIATNDVKGRLALAFRIETIEFELLGFFALRAEVSL